MSKNADKLQKVLNKKNKKKKEDVDDSVSDSDSEDSGLDEYLLFKACVDPKSVRPGLTLHSNRNNNGNVFHNGDPFWKRGANDKSDSDPNLALPACSVVLEKLLNGEIMMAQDNMLPQCEKNPYVLEVPEMKSRDMSYFTRDNVLQNTMRGILEMTLFECPKKDPRTLRKLVPLKFWLPRQEFKYNMVPKGFYYPCIYKMEKWEATGLGVCHKKKKSYDDDDDDDDKKKDKEKKEKGKDKKADKAAAKKAAAKKKADKKAAAKKKGSVSPAASASSSSENLRSAALKPSTSATNVNAAPKSVYQTLPPSAGPRSVYGAPPPAAPRGGGGGGGGGARSVYLNL